MEKRRFQIHYLGEWWTKPWAIFEKHHGYWQQISKSYAYKKNALKFAKRNGIILEN